MDHLQGLQVIANHVFPHRTEDSRWNVSSSSVWQVFVYIFEVFFEKCNIFLEKEQKYRSTVFISSNKKMTFFYHW